MAMSFVREHKWLLVLVVLSLITIGVGIFLIQQSRSQQQDEQKQLDLYNRIASQAADNLMQTVAHPDVPIEDIVPAESVAKVNAMNGKIPESGSDDWCELMMTKDGKSWSKEEQSQFAQNCI
jgi:type II secretory pathway pseudopilin PulG